ncbi:MAG TPA: septal ring lytic transglycosylase RlpA family protein [Ramlibacter sp.]|jgi:rare lipoprotein A|uniref:septal ring lytic transglycosylase RlpA family protein n=1 Tax=Ramlibacter sp. TaxID=1917967 RepID=UPI002D3DE370|nr:septal ring lytic transglycosylase RlpA family protein [Ramlibacter sp.]HZY19111.1 septal ring lytic transglycosylase RlpA family protein [Ramlibacter sp.]
MPSRQLRRPAAAILAGLTALVCQAGTPAASAERAAKAAKPAASGHRLDQSGRRQVGKASFYARRFAGRKMADGTVMDPRDDNAASKTLPLGTKARVTNLETGRSAIVTIQDRGPYVDGRIVDLSPATAERIGLTPDKGIATVEVAPIAVPLPDGSVKPGSGAPDGFAVNDR